MSKSAGTLVTTHNSTYINPRFMPGYKGHVPTMKFDYAETYGNATAKYLQDYRSKTLESSKSNYEKGGYFPTYYTHNSDLAVGHRTRQWDRWLQEPRYTLTNVDHDRKEELIRFNQMAGAHREHYKDRSQQVPPIDHFQLPRSAKDVYNMNMHTPAGDCFLPDIDEMTTRGSKDSSRQNSSRSNSQREREMRDVFFEQR